MESKPIRNFNGLVRDLVVACSVALEDGREQRRDKLDYALRGWTPHPRVASTFEAGRS